MKVVQVKLYCDECGELMEQVDALRGSYMTVSYKYCCPECGWSVITKDNYPKVEYIATSTPVITK